MKMYNLASSSEGNCYYVEFENQSSILLEAGISLKEIKRKLMQYNLTLANVDVVLITHNHKDHCLSAKSLNTSEFKRVWGNLSVCSENSLLEPFKTHFITSKIQVIPFDVEHDAENSLGYVIISGKEKLLFVNDCKFFKADIYTIPFDYIMIECNYTAKVVHTLHSNAKKENDYALIKRYDRLLNAHMSERNCLKILKKMNLKNCKAIFLMHLSDAHSNQEDYKREFSKELNVPVYICKKNGGIY